MCPKCLSLRLLLVATGNRNKLYKCKRCNTVFVIIKGGELGTTYSIRKKETMEFFLQNVRMK